MNVNVLRHIHAAEGFAEIFRLIHIHARNGAIVQNVLIVINVVQEEIQRNDPLGQSRFEFFPFGSRKHTRHRIERKDPLGTFVIVVDIEGNALPQEVHV